MGAFSAFGLALATATALLVLVWVIQLFNRQAGWVDVFWSASIGVIGLEYALAGDAPTTARFIMAVLALAWSLRLAGYLAKRMKDHGEDSRYAAARERWGKKADLYLLGFFIFQAIAAVVLAIPFLVIAYMDEGPSLITGALAIVVWLISVIGEGTADAQLKAFKAKPENKGKVCRQGLWYYSRHPNYFFESLHWVAYVVLAIGATYWLATLISPILMAFLLLKVSGVPTVESKDASDKREGHDEYVRTTNAFIPWPPKR